MKKYSDYEKTNTYLFLNVFYIHINEQDLIFQKFQLNFEYNNIEYKYFTVSDRCVLSYLANKPDGKYFYRSELPVVFSLTDKYENTGKYFILQNERINEPLCHRMSCLT